MKKILVFICLALCMLLFVCSCGGGSDTDTQTDTNTDTQADTSTDTNTDTSSDTSSDSDTDEAGDSGIDLNDGKYRVFVCNEDGEGIAGAFVQYCLDALCQFGETDADGYIEIPSGEYHVQRVDDVNEEYASVVYEVGSEPHFEADSKLITIVLTLK